MSAPTAADGRVKFALCSSTGCGEARVDHATMLAASPDQLMTMLLEDASAQGILLGEFEKRQLRERVGDVQRSLLAAEDGR